jgi:hypothetical protein
MVVKNLFSSRRWESNTRRGGLRAPLRDRANHQISFQFLLYKEMDIICTIFNIVATSKSWTWSKFKKCSKWTGCKIQTMHAILDGNKLCRREYILIYQPLHPLFINRKCKKLSTIKINLI